MCSSENELIHDVRQVHLEELIMKNEEQFVMVRFPMTDRQKDDLLLHDIAPDDVLEAVTNIGTPILPCADVETVCWLDPSLLDALLVGRKILLGVTLANIETPTRNIPLVRRTDMEAQVACMKMLLRPILTKMDYAAHELEQTEAAQSVHQLAHICLSLLSDDEAIRKSALDEWESLNEGSGA